MNKFDSFCNQILEAYSFGATAYGNANIDKTTASEIQKGILKPEWQYLGNKNNKLIAGYSIANNKLPHGTIVKIIDKRTGEPVGKEFGNEEGIYRVDDTGGSNVNDNIDFYSGSNVQMYNYFANIGKNSDNLEVTPINLPEGSDIENQMLAKSQQGGTTGNKVAQTANQSGKQQNKEEDSFTSGLSKQISDIYNKAGGITAASAKAALATAVNTGLGLINKYSNNKSVSDTNAFLGKGAWKTTDDEEKENKKFLGEV
jgi:3D (Asp-Asp-Asp) domain-containing protein